MSSADELYHTMYDVYNTLARHNNERDPDVRMENGDLSQASLSEYSYSQRSVADVATLDEVLSYIDSMLAASCICRAIGSKGCNESRGVCVKNRDFFSCEPDVLMDLLGKALSADVQKRTFRDELEQAKSPSENPKRGREDEDDVRDLVIQRQSTEDVAWHKSFIKQVCSYYLLLLFSALN
jgi:hypothetical protein